MKVDKRHSRFWNIYSRVICLLTPAAAFLLLELMTHKLTDMAWPMVLLNILFYYLLYGFLFVLTKRSYLSLSIGTGIVAVITVADYYVFSFRSMPIFPWDLLSLKTAASVSDNFSYAMDGKATALVLLFALLFAAGCFTRWTLHFKSFQYYLLTLLSTVACLTGYFSVSQMESLSDVYGFYPYLFTPNVYYHSNGFVLSFLSNMQYLNISAPKGYSLEWIEETMAPYVGKAEEEAAKEDEEKPNIIVIMNEAFSEPALLGEFKTNVDYMPFIHNLHENTVKGNLYVSVKGGNTANTEFEFLSGDTMAFLPQSSIPYQQYVTGELPGLVSFLKEKGCDTVSMHPFDADGWNRDKVYEGMGFDTSLFYPDFDSPDIIRTYTSDKTTYDKIIELYNEKEEGSPLFVFDVTMQNHSGYTNDYDNFTPDVAVEGIDENSQLDKYLSLIKISDEAFGGLIDYFSEAEEPTIILMFGDHQPTDIVVEPVYELNAQEQESLSFEDSQKRYIVPFVMWANYELEEKQVDYTSANYLSGLLLQEAGLSLSPYQYYLEDLKASIPAITGNMYIDEEGLMSGQNEYDNADIKEKLLGYERLNYYHLFEKKRIGRIYGSEGE